MVAAAAANVIDRLLTPTEAARALSISTKHLARLRRERLIAATQIGTRHVRFSPSAIEEFIARQTTQAAAS